MIKFSKFNLFSQALLAGAAAFTGCSSDEVIVEEQAPVTGPLTFNGESDQDTVLHQHPCRRKPQASDGKRNTGTDHPRIPRHEKHLHGAFRTGWSSGRCINLVTQRCHRLDSIQRIPDFRPNANYYSDVDIPVNTNHMLFYAEGGAESETTQKQYGSLKPIYDASTWTVTTQLQNAISFELNQIATGGTSSTETQITNSLNAIAQNDDWAAITLDQNPELYNAYVGFTSLRAGSAKKILYTVNSLYQIVKDKATDGSIYKAIKNSIISESGIFMAVQTITSNTRIPSRIQPILRTWVYLPVWPSLHSMEKTRASRTATLEQLPS